MRKILMFTRFGLSAITSATRKVTAVAFTTGLIVLAGTSQSTAQYPVQYAASAAGGYSGQASNNTSVFGSSVMKLGDAAVTAGTRSAVVDSAFRGSPGTSNVKAASYNNAWDSAECYSGYGPGASCNINYYFFAEGLLFRREGDKRFSLTQNVSMDNYDFEFGGRLTAGWMCDCANAYEFVYAGPFSWQRRSDVSGAGTINSLFTANPTTLDDAFNGANRHIQVLEADLNSFELNQRVWAWDAVSTLVGIRYLKYEEDYLLTSVRGAAPLAGVYRQEIVNDLLGLQVGGDVFFPTSLRTMVSVKGKAGLFANFGQQDLRLQDTNGTTLVTGDEDVDFSGLIELGANGFYELTPSIRLTGGYEAWMMFRMATEAGQRPNFLNPGSGTSLNMDEEILVHGLTFGAQVLY